MGKVQWEAQGPKDGKASTIGMDPMSATQTRGSLLDTGFELTAVPETWKVHHSPKQYGMQGKHEHHREAP